MFQLFIDESNMGPSELIMFGVKSMMKGYHDNSFYAHQTEVSKTLSTVYDSLIEQLKILEKCENQIKGQLDVLDTDASTYSEWYVKGPNDRNYLNPLLCLMADVKDANSFESMMEYIKQKDTVMDIGKAPLIGRANVRVKINEKALMSGYELSEEDNRFLDKVFGMDVETALSVKKELM